MAFFQPVFVRQEVLLQDVGIPQQVGVSRKRGGRILEEFANVVGLAVNGRRWKWTIVCSRPLHAVAMVKVLVPRESVGSAVRLEISARTAYVSVRDSGTKTISATRRTLEVPAAAGISPNGVLHQ